jgi:hypothetical protein
MPVGPIFALLERPVGPAALTRHGILMAEAYQFQEQDDK